jgi:hypothetical protein
VSSSFRPVVALALVALLACGGTESPVTPGPVTPSVSPAPLPVPGPATLAFVSILGQAFPDVRIVEVMAEPSFSFFPVRAVRLTAAGENVYVFEFADAAAAATSASRFSGDGSTVGMTHVDWIAAPHFYRSGTLVVLYVGSTHALLDALEQRLGPQFAGR